jgi:hypothetical protein
MSERGGTPVSHHRVPKTDSERLKRADNRQESKGKKYDFSNKKKKPAQAAQRRLWSPNAG